MGRQELPVCLLLGSINSQTILSSRLLQSSDRGTSQLVLFIVLCAIPHAVGEGGSVIVGSDHFVGPPRNEDNCGVRQQRTSGFGLGLTLTEVLPDLMHEVTLVCQGSERACVCWGVGVCEHI